jgi:ABC-2 type transport system permease protein
VRPALAVARNEWRNQRRRQFTFLVLIQPAIWSLVWGVCVSLELLDAPLVVLDLSQSAESRTLLRDFAASGAFRVAREAADDSAFASALESGEAGLGLIVGQRFARDLRRRPEPALQLVADGTDPNMAGLGLARASAIVRASVARLRGTASVERPHARAWYNPDLRSRDLLLLGAICYNLMWFLVYPATSLMDERERGTLDALRASPLRPAELWLGLVGPHLVLALWGGLVQIALACALGGVPFRGNPALLLGVLALLGLSHLNLGCLLPLVAKDASQRTLYALIFLILCLALSGFLLPLPHLPDWARAVADFVPLRYGLTAVRAVFLKGASAGRISRELWALGAFVIATSAAAWLSLRSLLRPAT